MHALIVNIKVYFTNLFIDFKRLCKENKLVIICLSISLLLGLVMSFQNNMKEQQINVYVGNIIILIKNQSFNIFMHIFKICLYIALIYAFILLVKVHFVAYLGNFVFILIFIRLFFKSLFLAFIFDGFYALLYFMFFWLPIFIYSLLCYFYFLCRIFYLLGYEKSKGRSLCCPAGNTYINLLLKSYAVIVIPIIIYNLIFCFVVSLIY